MDYGDLWDDKWVTLGSTTETVTWFGGYTGWASVVVVDANNVVLAQTPKQQFGVDGTWIGRSRRYDEWRHQFGPELDLSRVARIAPVHEWHLYFEPGKWIKTGEQIAPWLVALLGL